MSAPIPLRCPAPTAHRLQWNPLSRFPLNAKNPPMNVRNGDRITQMKGETPFAWERQQSRHENLKRRVAKELEAARKGPPDGPLAVSHVLSINFRQNYLKCGPQMWTSVSIDLFS